MKFTQSSLARFALLSALAALIPSQVFALAISPGSNTVGTLGAIANSIVRIDDPGGRGTGTILQISPYQGGVDLLVLTADHVVRNASGGGSTLYSPSQISIGFGNLGGGGPSFAASEVATLFDLPFDGSSAVDLAMLDVFIPGSQLNTLPSPLTAADLPHVQPAAGNAITQAGYGRQGTVATVSGNIAYVYSVPNGLGAVYGTLAAGPNTVGAGGVTTITGAVSDFAGQNYVYEGFQNGALINGVSPNYNGSTSYIFSGDSGGPSLNGNVIVGVHSSSVTGTISGDPNSEFAYANVFGAGQGHQWQDVNVNDYLPWIKLQLDTLSPVPEPTTLALALFGLVGLLVCARRARRS